MTAVSRAEVNSLINLYNKAKIDNSILIDIPIIGVTFDINGLSVISTVGFGIIYFLLFYSLARERKNLKLVFKIAKEYEIDEIKLYQILSMRHVLTVPQSIDEFLFSSYEKEKKVLTKLSDRFFRTLPLLPLILPVLLCLLIFVNDNKTQDVGKSVNMSLTDTNFYLTIFFGSIMVFMCALCIKEWKNIGRVYDKVVTDLISKKEPKFYFLLSSTNKCTE